MELSEIANIIKTSDKKIILIYAFNATGKTRLSVAYKNITKKGDGQHSGVYYNAFSEDLFIWNNDSENDEENIHLIVNPSSLNKFHGLITEDNVREKLIPYNAKYDFRFKFYDDPEKGIETIAFYIKDSDSQESSSIKISRGEERIFIWCFFLALFDVEGWTDQQSSHFFIDDPVSSLDDHNIFVTASTLFDLIDKHHESRKCIITTHHIGFFAILADWLMKGEKGEKFKKLTKPYILSSKAGSLSLENPKNDVFLYHLHLLQVLDKALSEQLYTFHFALLRQALENIASFLGVGQFRYVLDQIGIEDTNRVANIVNALSHQKVYYYQTELMKQDDEALFRDVFNGLKAKYKFVLHSDVS
jgi:AAA domain